jgi:hypothetical protein
VTRRRRGRQTRANRARADHDQSRLLSSDESVPAPAAAAQGSRVTANGGVLPPRDDDESLFVGLLSGYVIPASQLNLLGRPGLFAALNDRPPP